jgi:putative ABC transport system substrate-binding protein
MRRRELMLLVGGIMTAARTLRAQKATPRVAVLMAVRDADPDGRAWLNGFLQAFQKLGWTDGANVRVDVRWASGNLERAAAIAAEFVAMRPDVIVTNASPATVAMKHATSSIPIVFVVVSEPVAQGMITSVPRPGGNITGFTYIDFPLIGKSAELLKTMAPAITRVGLMFNPETFPHWDLYLPTLQAEARLIEFTRVAVRSPAEIEAAIAAFAEQPGGGLVILPDGGFTNSNRGKIRAALEQYRLPHIVPWRQFVSEGALMSYSPDIVDIFRRSADYVDRILKGANPAELPVQAPDRFELVINLNTAKALDLTVPQSIFSRADDVIE